MSLSSHSKQSSLSTLSLETSSRSQSQKFVVDLHTQQSQELLQSGSLGSWDTEIFSNLHESQPSYSSTVDLGSHPATSSSSWVTTNQGDLDVDPCVALSDGRLDCGWKAGMLGMVLSVVGSCMKAVEPAQRNLMEDPEFVHEASEDSSRSLVVDSTAGSSRQVEQVGVVDGHSVWPEYRPNGVHNNLYIIEEYLGVEEAAYQPPEFTPGVVSYSQDVASVHTVTNKNVRLKNGEAVRGSTSRRPLVLVFGSQPGGTRSKRSKSSTGGY
ncbi:uncharacterized protein [Cherax quadricarinatus]|nr:uncharacterized protein LOC128690306 isoform X2 [Cherax quadricarinatus]XP_053634902.1 uncharacterized protein LOC128690306 isoform X2 [Cherax quadricarinatus]